MYFGNNKIYFFNKIVVFLSKIMYNLAKGDTKMENLPKISVNKYSNDTIVEVASPSKDFSIYNEYEPMSLSLFSVRKTERIAPSRRVKPSVARIMYAFIRTSSGTGKITTTNETYILEPNSLFFINVYEVIEYAPVSEKWSYVWYNFTPKSTIPFEQKVVYYLPFTYDETNLVDKMFNAMESHLNTSLMLTHSLFLELICSWLHFFECEKKREIPHNKSMSEILSYINDNLDKKFTVSYLAKRCLMSERLFRTVFEKHTGMSPKKYINQQRLNYVAFLLRTTTLAIQEISYNLNFCSPYELSKDFKSFFGITPKEYRNTKH